MPLFFKRKQLMILLSVHGRRALRRDGQSFTLLSPESLQLSGQKQHQRRNRTLISMNFKKPSPLYELETHPERIRSVDEAGIVFKHTTPRVLCPKYSTP